VHRDEQEERGEEGGDGRDHRGKNSEVVASNLPPLQPPSPTR
jgi:hypothetical protein